MNRILDRQLLKQEFSGCDSPPEFETYLAVASAYSVTENAVAVLSDLKERTSHIFYGGFGETLGIAGKGTVHSLKTIWEEEILCRISSADLERKQLEELRFFEFIRHGASADEHYMQSSLVMRDAVGREVKALHRIFYFRHGKSVRFALCLYTPAMHDVLPAIVHSLTGKIVTMNMCGGSGILSSRECEVLALVDEGLSSKDIALRLSISLHTVSRHRQNIMFKLRACNSAQACRMAKSLNLI